MTEGKNTSSFHLHHGDALEWLRSVGDAEMDLIVTDVAYESLEKHRAKGTTTRLKVSGGSSNEWFPIFRNEQFPALFAEMFRVLKKDRHLYFFCDEETADIAKPIGKAAGFTFWKSIVWRKDQIGMGYHYRNQHEFILFFEKGKRRLNDLGMSSVLDAKKVRGGYPTEKPVDLISKLIVQSTEPGELVLDPFMGSGAVGEAALTLGRHFLGGDVQEKSIDLARSRLAPLGEESIGASVPTEPAPFNPATSPGMTDLMIAPEAIDTALPDASVSEPAPEPAGEPEIKAEPFVTYDIVEQEKGGKKVWARDLSCRHNAPRSSCVLCKTRR